MTIIKLDFTDKDPYEVEKFLELTENKLFVSDEDFIDSFGENPLEEIEDIISDDRLSNQAKDELLNAHSAEIVKFSLKYRIKRFLILLIILILLKIVEFYDKINDKFNKIIE